MQWMRHPLDGSVRNLISGARETIGASRQSSAFFSRSNMYREGGNVRSRVVSSIVVISGRWKPFLPFPDIHLVLLLFFFPLAPPAEWGNPEFNHLRTSEIPRQKKKRETATTTTNEEEKEGIQILGCVSPDQFQWNESSVKSNFFFSSFLFFSLSPSCSSVSIADWNSSPSSPALTLFQPPSSLMPFTLFHSASIFTTNQKSSWRRVKARRIGVSTPTPSVTWHRIAVRLETQTLRYSSTRRHRRNRGGKYDGSCP